MSTLNLNIKPGGFQVFRMIKCGGLCYFSGNSLFILDYCFNTGTRGTEGCQRRTKMAGKMKILL